MSNSNAAGLSAPPGELPLSLVRARALTREIQELLGRRRGDLAAVAHKLRAIQQGELYRALGYTSVYTCAWKEHEFGKTKVTDLIGISRESESLPRIREAFESGRLDWTKAREIVKAATTEDEGDWLERAKHSTGEELRDEARGEPKRIRRRFTFSPEQAARFDQFLGGIQSEQRGVSDSEAVLILLERGASGALGQAPVRRIVINECPTCLLATSESREGPVQVRAGDLVAARCSGETHDLREEDNQVKRAIPACVRRRVLDRDRRCVVPGCRSLAGLDVHHEDGWRKGHHADRMLSLCGSHHRARHDGYLQIKGSYPRFRFLCLGDVPYEGLGSEVAGETPAEVAGETPAEVASETSAEVADETPVEVAGETPAEVAGETPAEVASETSAEVAGETPAKVAGETPPEVASETSAEVAGETPAKVAGEAPPEVVARRALESLGMRRREASSLLERVRHLRAARAWTAETLLTAALRAA